MSDFIINEIDYVDFIKNEDDLKKFNRLKELDAFLDQPIFKCYKQVNEFMEIDGDLRGIPHRKIIVVNDPKLN